jgi:hypothetical protein
LLILVGVNTILYYTQLLYLLGAVFNFGFHLSHIAGKDNIAADAISQFLQIYPVAAEQPTPIPSELKTALCQSAPNWTCENWRKLFGDILSKA